MKRPLAQKNAKGLAACFNLQASGEPGITTVMLVHPTGKTCQLLPFI
jgi:hypothetical protein